jgi:hypothetical protein
MKMDGDHVVRFEENNYDVLSEKFIDLHRAEWDEFVQKECEKAEEDRDDE